MAQKTITFVFSPTINTWVNVGEINRPVKINWINISAPILNANGEYSLFRVAKRRQGATSPANGDLLLDITARLYVGALGTAYQQNSIMTHLNMITEGHISFWVFNATGAADEHILTVNYSDLDMGSCEQLLRSPNNIRV